MNTKIRNHNLFIFSNIAFVLILSLISFSCKRTKNNEDNAENITLKKEFQYNSPNYMQKNDTDSTYINIEQMPQFPGGEAELLKFISKNIKYPNTESCVQGRVILRFVVTKTGEVDSIEVIRSLELSFDKEAIRVVKSMPRWTPGKQNGKNVNVWFTLPINFRIG